MTPDGLVSLGTSQVGTSLGPIALDSVLRTTIGRNLERTEHRLEWPEYPDRPDFPARGAFRIHDQEMGSAYEPEIVSYTQTEQSRETDRSKETGRIRGV